MNYMRPVEAVIPERRVDSWRLAVAWKRSRSSYSGSTSPEWAEGETDVSPVIHLVMTNVSIRDLRNHGGEIIDRVEHGEAVRVTRDGRPVAELRPLEAQRLTLPAILERFRSLPAMDPIALREDIDSVIDTSL
jgi:prevent-host-death family protein